MGCYLFMLITQQQHDQFCFQTSAAFSITIKVEVLVFQLGCSEIEDNWLYNVVGQLFNSQFSGQLSGWTSLGLGLNMCFCIQALILAVNTKKDFMQQQFAIISRRYYVLVLIFLRWMLQALGNFLLYYFLESTAQTSAKELNQTSGGVCQSALIIIHWLIRRQPPIDIEVGSKILVTMLTKAPQPIAQLICASRKATLYLSQGHFLKQQKAVLKKQSMMVMIQGKQTSSNSVMRMSRRLTGVQQTISNMNDCMRLLISVIGSIFSRMSSQGMLSLFFFVFHIMIYIAWRVTSILQNTKQPQVKISDRPITTHPRQTHPSCFSRIGRNVVISPACSNERPSTRCNLMLWGRILPV